MIDVFGIVADIFVSHSFGTHCIDTDLRTVLQWRHFSRDSIPKDSDKQDGDDGEGQGNPAQLLAVYPVHPFEERFGLAIEPALLFPFD